DLPGGHQPLPVGQFVQQEVEIRVGGGALLVARLEPREQGGDIWVAIDGNTVDLVPGQGELFAAFTDFVEIVEGREGDIGHDAPVLGALPGNPVELRLGELELA